MNIGKPQTMKLAPAKVAKPVVPKQEVEDVIEDVEDVKVVDVPKPERKTVQGPDLDVRVPGSTAPNGEPVLPFQYRGFFCGG